MTGLASTVEIAIDMTKEAQVGDSAETGIDNGMDQIAFLTIIKLDST